MNKYNDINKRRVTREDIDAICGGCRYLIDYRCTVKSPDECPHVNGEFDKAEDARWAEIYKQEDEEKRRNEQNKKDN